MGTAKEIAIKSLSIRIPVDVLEPLRERAKQHDRSLNGEIVTALREYLKKSQKDK